jgi:hypothetical protein
MYRLGRLANRPDLRDWSAGKLHMALTSMAPSDAELQMPFGDAIKTLAYFSSWQNYRLFWREVKKIRAGAPVTPSTATSKVWDDPIVLDQGDFGTCIGNGGAGFLASDPVMDPNVDENLARALYYESTVIDGSPDPSYQNGSTIRSLAKALQNRGRVAAYAMATTIGDVDEWLLNHGSIPIGIDWTNDMFDPDKDGLLHVTGGVAGGHCVLLNGIDDAGMYVGTNSWGPNWGDNGRFKIGRADLKTLLHGIETPGDFLLAAELPL